MEASALHSWERPSAHASGLSANPKSFGRPRAPLAVSIARAYRSIEDKLNLKERRICDQARAVSNQHRRSRELSLQRRTLEALADTRLALLEALRVDFGDRFQLSLNVSDREGWPMLELHLIDRLSEFLPGMHGTVRDSMSASAIEHQQSQETIEQTIFFSINHGEVIAHLNLSEDQEPASLPELITDAVLSFLNRVADDVEVQQSTASDPAHFEPTIQAEEIRHPSADKATPTNPKQGHQSISREEQGNLDADLLSLDFLSEENI